MAGNPQLRRHFNAVRRMHDEGFSVDIIVELALAGRMTPVKDDLERQIVRDIYAEELGLQPKSAARLRGERAMREFLAEKAAP